MTTIPASTPSVPTRADPGVPTWVDRAAYPFRSRWLDTGEGRLHYVDEGEGPPVLLVHGTPTWSFVYRDLIRRLAATHRVVAVDHLGFGLSDRPAGAGYRPADHARRLAALIDALALRDFALVVHDFGGPIGLAYAIERPERVARLVVLNTWLWPLDDDPTIARAGRLAGGALGRFLYTRLNASPRWLIPAAFADRSRLTTAVHRQYLAPFPDAASRVPLWVLARELLGSSAWYDGLHQRVGRLADTPALLLWGMRDPAFGPSYLARWRAALPHAAVVELPDAGHFVQEEAADDLGTHVTDFLRPPLA